MPETDLPLATSVSEELAEQNLYNRIREAVADGYNHISLLNARIENTPEGDNQIVAVVFAAKESV